MQDFGNTKPKVTIYTDGACSGNPGPGGWGAILMFKENKKEIFGYEIDTTNNKMEMQAAISALQTLTTSCIVELYTDSVYVKKGITEWIDSWCKNNWLKRDNKPVKNSELWQKLHYETQKHTIIWFWVKGHSQNKGNDIADSLAVRGREIAKKIQREK